MSTVTPTLGLASNRFEIGGIRAATGRALRPRLAWPIGRLVAWYWRDAEMSPKCPWLGDGMKRWPVLAMGRAHSSRPD